MSPVPLPSAPFASVLQVSVDIENTGSSAGSVVVQIYAHDPPVATRAVRYMWRLIAFDKIYLVAAERRTITVDVSVDALSFITPRPSYRHQLHSGVYQIKAGQYFEDPEAALTSATIFA